MIRPTLIAAAALLAGFAASHARDQWSVTPRSVTRSGQFVVYCADNRLRMEVGSFVETAKGTTLGILGVQDDWARPIVITFSPRETTRPEQPVSELRLLDVEGGIKIEINVVLEGNLAEARFPHRVVEAILTEIAYRKTAETGGASAYRRPPEWLVAGIALSLPGRDGPHLAGEVCRGLVGSGNIPPLEEFLAMRQGGTDSISTRFFEACSYALVKLLCDLPEGRRNLVRFVRALPSRADGGAGELSKAFPTLGESGVAREKWWALGIARLSGSERYRGLDLKGTLERLDAALTWDLPDREEAPSSRVNLRDFRNIGRTKRDIAALDRIAGQLLSLQAEAHPLLRPIVLSWHDLACRLAKGNRRGVALQIEQLDAEQHEIAARVDAIADYMNWIQASKPTEKTGAFDGYLRAARETNPGHSFVSGNDPIARYLDEMEKALGELQ